MENAVPATLASTEWSEIEVANVRGKSALITCKNIQPLKILNPGSPAVGCHVVLSSYGGGMVAGDKIWLRLRCHAGSRLLLSTQANTKIFRSVDGAVAEQRIEGELGENGLAVIFPDPVVLQEKSRYRQVQHWNLAPGALLLVADWLHSGRMDSGERFVFDSFYSELKVNLGGRPVVLDRFVFNPHEHIATSPANFAQYQTVLSVYLVGDPVDARFALLADALLALKMPESTELHFQMTAGPYVVSVTKVKEGVYVVRALAKSRLELQPLIDKLMQALAAQELFGYNPLKRKY
jgi:urease accessory protein